ncbi:uncharacterized protein LOC118765430 [Octopus sinensis]|uniref:Uncharacterized protein LOC118765430 n=1 Tax=Octopus sinensis TaxID=2607531 RepID=A0A7E6F7B6_9MOLL|nr:uncharacterized protein LOC118765430 [Octopus sinensis]
MDSTLSYFAQYLCNLEKFDEFKNWIDNLTKSRPLLFEELKEDEDFVFSIVSLRIHEEKFYEAFELIENGTFTNPERFISLWDKAHYKLKEKEKGFPLTPLLRFRVRKKYPPPKSICPSGKRPSSNLPEHARQTLKQWFNKHADYPYPDEHEKKQLVEQSGLILSQVKTWFANTRRRKKLTAPKSNLKYGKIMKHYHQYNCSSQSLTDGVDYALDMSMKKVGLYPDEENFGQTKMDNKKLQDQCFFKVQESGNICKEDDIISKEIEQNKEQGYYLENKEMEIKSDTKDSHETRQLNSVLFENAYPVLRTQNFIIPKENNYCDFVSEQNVDAVGNVCNTYTLPIDGEYPDDSNVLQDCVEIKSVENDLFPNESSEAVTFLPNETVLMPNINPALPVTLWQLPLLPTDCLISFTNQNITTNSNGQTPDNCKYISDLNNTSFIHCDQTSQYADNKQFVPDTPRENSQPTEYDASNNARNMMSYEMLNNSHQGNEDPNIHNIKLSTSIPDRTNINNNTTTIIEYNFSIPQPLMERKESQTCVPPKQIEEEIAEVLLNLSTNLLENSNFNVKI